MVGKTTYVVRIHLGLFFAEVICVSAFALELTRALSGNTLSWAYVVEWPVLGAYAVYMWRKLLKDEESEPGAISVADTSPREEEDPRLIEWNKYLAQVHSHDQSDQDDT